MLCQRFLLLLSHSGFMTEIYSPKKVKAKLLWHDTVVLEMLIVGISWNCMYIYVATERLFVFSGQWREWWTKIKLADEQKDRQLERGDDLTQRCETVKRLMEEGVQSLRQIIRQEAKAELLAEDPTQTRSMSIYHVWGSRCWAVCHLYNPVWQPVQYLLLTVCASCVFSIILLSRCAVNLWLGYVCSEETLFCCWYE